MNINQEKAEEEKTSLGGEFEDLTVRRYKRLSQRPEMTDRLYTVIRRVRQTTMKRR